MTHRFRSLFLGCHLLCDIVFLLPWNWRWDTLIKLEVFSIHKLAYCRWRWLRCIISLCLCNRFAPFGIQELIFLDDLLSALVGVEGRYISIKRFPGKDDSIALQVDPSMDLALQASGTQHSSSSFLSLGKYPYVLTSQEKSREVLPYIMLYLYMCLLP